MNLWRRFQELAAPPPLRTVGVVVAAEFGRCIVELQTGNRIRVTGAGTVGQAYFILDGRLDGEAASLQVLELDL